MPTQTHPYLAIDTLVFMDGAGGNTNYRPVAAGWAPSIAGRRNNRMSGPAPYEDVVEEITINIYGTTAAEALANLATLATLLDRAERWTAGEYETVVLIKYAPQGSTIASTATPYQAVVLGRAEDDETSGVALSPETLDGGFTYVIRDVRIRIKRRGLWVYPTATTTAFGGSVGNPLLMETPVLATPDVPSYSTIGVGTVNASSTMSGYLLLSDELISVLNAEVMTATGFTSVNDAANNALSSSVLRYTPTSTAAAQSGLGTSLSPFAWRYQVLATIRNNAASRTWTVRPILELDGTVYYGQYTIIDDGSTTPQPIHLGEVATALGIAGGTLQLRLEISVDSTSGSPTLDIDTIILMPIDSERTHTVVLRNLSLSPVNHTIMLHAGHSLHQSLAQFLGGPFIEYQGNINVFTKAIRVYGVLLACGGSAATSWRHRNASGVLSLAIMVSRYNSYLVAR